MDITVAICTYRRYEGVAAAIQSLRGQDCTFCQKLRIIVIDNAPETHAAANTALAKVQLEGAQFEVVTEPNLGVSHARNCALEECKTELLAYLDDDCIASSHWLQNLVATYQIRPDVGAVGGKVTPLWKCEPPTWFSRPLGALLSIVDLGEEVSELSPSQWIVGGNVLYSASRLREIGGFRAHLGRVGNVLLSNEEVEVCNRLRRQGYKILYTPGAVVTHTISADRLHPAWFRKRIFWQVVSDFLADCEADKGSRIPIQSASQLAKVAQSSSLQNLMVDPETPEDLLDQLRFLFLLTRVLASGATLQDVGTL